MEKIPGGIVTFLFTDIEGSTKLAQEFPETLKESLKRHNDVIQEIIISNKGYVFELIGDAFCVSFDEATDAVKSAYEIQIKLKEENWIDSPIKVRIGIHIGKAEWNESSYLGYITLARTQRIMSVAYGGQTIISNDVHEKLKDRVFKDFSFRDLGERRLKDLIHPVKIFQLISPKLRNEFPQLKTLDARPNNLPVQLTSFIGRGEQIEQIKNILKQTHLATITGTGGSGKTRLALQVSAEIIDEFENGVWYAELASLNDPLLLPQLIAQTLGLKEEPMRSMEETLCDYLRDRELLIILDNCEHMIDAAARLAEILLVKSPKLRIIATSREALRCSGEMTHRVLSLDTPDPRKKISIEQLSQYDSVSLFLERASAVNSNFKITKENSLALAGICSQLDGIPLAIELAAARVKVLSVEKINERLNDRFKLLTGGKRTSLPRQQTLKALIDWSYDLLSEKEKMLWGRLSIYSDGWTLESAEEICSDDKIETDEIMEIMYNLNEKSVVIFNEEKDRYRMLETIRQYGEEKLKETHEEEIFENKHFEYFKNFVLKTEPKMFGAEMQKNMEKISQDYGNIETALNRTLKNNDIENGMEIAASLGNYWQIQGNFFEGSSRLESLIESTKGIKTPVLGKVLNTAGIFTRILGEYEKAENLINNSLEINREYGNDNEVSNSLNSMGNLNLDKGENENAINNFEESIKIYNETGNKKGLADSINDLARVFLNKGENEKAEKLFKESLAIMRGIGYKPGISTSITNLGVVALNKGDLENAGKLFEESLEIRKETGDKLGISKLLNNLGTISKSKKEFTKSREFYEKSLSIRREIGDKIGIAALLYNIGNLLIEEKEYKQSQDYFEECIILFRELGNKSRLALSLKSSGLAFYEQDDFAKAKKNIEECIKLKNEIFESEDSDMEELKNKLDLINSRLQN